jgi:hypothetical protein
MEMPTITSAKDIAEQYIKALDAKDYTRARTFLADNLAFVGPIDTFYTPEPLIVALKKLVQRRRDEINSSSCWISRKLRVKRCPDLDATSTAVH